MSEDRYTPFKKALLHSCLRLGHLSVVAGSVVLGLGASFADVGGQMLPSLTLGLGVLTYGALVALDVTNPEFIRRVNSKVASPPPRAVPPAALRDPEVREVYTQILAASENCERVYFATGAQVRSSLEEAFTRTRDLVAVAGRAAERSDGIYRQLTDTSATELNAETERLRAQAARTTDETAREGFNKAAEAKVKELETYNQLIGLRDRVHAQLRLIETSLEGLSAKLVKLDATDYTEAVTISESIKEHVQSMSTEVEILESTFEDTFQEFRA